MTAAGRRPGGQSGSRRAREPRGRREQAAPTARTLGRLDRFEPVTGVTAAGGPRPIG